MNIRHQQCRFFTWLFWLLEPGVDTKSCDAITNEMQQMVEANLLRRETAISRLPAMLHWGLPEFSDCALVPHGYGQCRHSGGQGSARSLSTTQPDADRQEVPCKPHQACRRRPTPLNEMTALKQIWKP